MARDLTSVIGGEIAIGKAKYENTFTEDIAIDRTDLDGEFLTHSDKFAYYAGLAELALARSERVKFELDVLYAQLDVEKRQQFATYNESLDAKSKLKQTEKMVENEVIGDARYAEKMNEYLELKKTAAILNRAREAFNHRKEMLVQLASNSRVGDPKVKQEFVRAMLHGKEK